MAEPLVEEAPLPVFETPVYAPPRVNLLPPEIGERQALRRLQGGLAAGVLAAAGIVAVLYVQASGGKADAQSRLDAAKGQTAALTAAAAKFSYISSEKAEIDAARVSLKAALGSEILWSQTLDNLRRRLPDGVRYAALTVAAVAPAAATTAGTAATSTAAPAAAAPAAATPASAAAASTIPANTVATVTVTGNANDLDTVATELDQLALLPGFSNVYLTSTAQAGSGNASTATFAATADIGQAVLSHRYDNLTGGSK